MPSLGNNNTNKGHRDALKDKKRLAQLAKYKKHKGIPDAKKNTDTIYDPVKKRLDAMKRANPIGSMVTGISDTVKYVKDTKKAKKAKKEKIQLAKASGTTGKKKT